MPYLKSKPVVIGGLVLFCVPAIWAQTPARGPLRVHPTNPRYFTDGTKGPDAVPRAIYLTGSHVHHNLQDAGFQDPPRPFDYPAYLDLLAANNHNLIRLWAWESTFESGWNRERRYLQPLAFPRTGPGLAIDEKPRFDLTRFEESYFERLRERVRLARDRGFYVGVMLFQGFSIGRKGNVQKRNPWEGHPFNAANNINGVNGDSNGDGQGYEIHTLADPRITQIQDAYVRRVIEAVGDFENVIYEVSNEDRAESTEWQHRIMTAIRKYESPRRLQHAIWMSFQWDVHNRGLNSTLFRSTAEVVSPGLETGNQRIGLWLIDPPPSDGSKVVIVDTDHLNPSDTDRRAWVWKCFTRGLHPIVMDVAGSAFDPPGPREQAGRSATRAAMGHTRRFSTRINLVRMIPSASSDECSTRYCLRDPGREYLVYQPEPGRFTVNLPAGAYEAEWVQPRSGETAEKQQVKAAGGPQEFTPPFDGDAVLHLRLAGAN